jgi:antigen 43
LAAGERDPAQIKRPDRRGRARRMATFTWTATTGGVTTPWETTAAWSSSPAPFNTTPGNDYIISSANLFVIDAISANGTTDVANSLTLTSPNFTQAKLDVADGGQFDVTTTLFLNSLLNLGTTTGGSTLSMGGTDGGGIINIGTGLLEGALGDVITSFGTTTSEIMGAGTVIAESGLFQIGTTSTNPLVTAGSVDVAVGATTKFQIDPNTTLSFADAVGGGTIVFSTVNGATGTGVLDVAALSTFNAKVQSLYVGNGENRETSYIDFLNVGTAASAALSNITSAGATLTVFTDGGSQSITLLGTNYVGKYVNYVGDGNSGTNIFLTDTACYAAGTAILTPDGEVEIETIQAGDTVMTSSGGTIEPRTVIWTGLRAIDLNQHPTLEAVAPIRFHQGSLGHGLPRRDLLLSPDHCLFIDGALIPAKLLINDMTIVRDLSLTSVTYHHIELEKHAVLIAEGVEAESYLDTGNRAYFSNAGLATILHPEFGINEHLHCWETDACAPLTVRPEAVKPVWDQFASRAVALGFAAPDYATTTDPGIRLTVNGKIMRPLAVRDQTLSFMLPEAAGSIRLMSRSIIPSVLRPWLDDPRRLGVAVRSIMLRDRVGETVLSADHPALTDGWHGAEQAGDGACWRWSAGDAALPIVSDGPCVLEIMLSETTTYLADAASLAA